MNPIVNNLPPNPDITILIDGLLAICINKATQTPTSQVGVYPFAKDHVLTIEVKKTTQLEGEDKNEILLFRAQQEHLTGDVFASILGQEPDVKIFQQDGHAQDFRRVIDLEGSRFHQQKLDMVKGIIQQIIHITHGIYHTIGKRRAFVKPAFAQASFEAGFTDQQNQPTELELPTHIGVNVYLEKGETYCLQFGSNPTIKFEIHKEPGVSYEINVSNNCRKEADGAETECPSDFQNYYNLAEVRVAQRLDIEYVDDGQIGSERTPCDTVYLGQTPEFP